MKAAKGKKLAILLGIFGVITAVSIGLTTGMGRSQEEEDKEITIVTSFYPIYIATSNIVKEIDHVKVVNLMEKQTGCLHDYTLSTADMKKIETADVFVINGAGMEGYIETVAKEYPNLKIIDTSEGVELLEETSEHDHDHEGEKEEEHEHTHGEYNAHIWLNPYNYKIQIENIAKNLAEIDPEHQAEYEQNEKNYEEKIDTVISACKELHVKNEKKAIIFHDSFAYLADMVGIDVIASIEVEEDSSLSAGEIAEIIEEIKEENIKILLVEKQYEHTIADSIAKETEAKVYVVDSLVTGEESLNAYIDGMNENIKMIQTILEQ